MTTTLHYAPIRFLVCCALVLWFVSDVLAGDISFRKDVAPILLNRCVACHNEEDQQGGYRLSSFSSMHEAGDSEIKPIAQSTSEKSELLRRLTTSDEDERMPAESDALPAADVALIRSWIEQGAKYDAKDETASLSSILPVTKHPDAPPTYRFPIPITAIAGIDEQLLVSGYHEILRVDHNGKLAQRIPQVGERIYDIEFDAEQDRIYVASGSPGKLGEVRIVNATSGELLGVPIVSNEVMLKLATHPTQSLLAVAGGDRKIYVLDKEKISVVKTYDSHSDWVRSVRWSDDGTRLASASRDKTVKLFDLSRDQPIDTYGGLGEDVMDVMFLPGKTDELIACDAAGKVHRWQREAKKPHKFKFVAKQTFGLAAAEDGIWISSRAGRGDQAKYAITKFDWKGEKELESHELPGRGVSIESSPLCVGMKGQVWVGKKPDRPIDVLPTDRR